MSERLRVVKKGQNLLIVKWDEKSSMVHVSMDWDHQEVKPTPRTLLSLAKGLMEIAQDMISQVTSSTDIGWREVK